ncbi:MAG: hypothetical protein Q8K26_02840 [Candidatus Gracilibacteria bacterium]|nr:hypothetical protein [Candidatus Gracilibacteria bacterium]
MKKPTLLVIRSTSKKDSFFTQAGERGYDGLSQFFDILTIGINDLLFEERQDRTEIYIRSNKGFVNIDEYKIKAVILWLFDDFNDFIFSMIDVFTDKGIYVLNRKIFGRCTKINGYRLLKKAGYGERVIPNYFGYNGKSFYQRSIDWLTGKTGWRFLMKGNDGYGGEFVFDYGTFLKKSRKAFFHKSAWIFQKYIQNDGDVRVMVSGDWVFAYKRIRANETSLTNNVSQGGSMEAFQLPEHIQKEVLDIAHKIEGDYLGFDYIIDKQTGEWYILEINETTIGTANMQDLFGVNPYEHVGKCLYEKISSTIQKQEDIFQSHATFR